MKVSKGRFSKSLGLRASVSFSPFPSPTTHFFAPAPILPGPKKQKVHERAQSLTETLATQASIVDLGRSKGTLLAGDSLTNEGKIF